MEKEIESELGSQPVRYSKDGNDFHCQHAIDNYLSHQHHLETLITSADCKGSKVECSRFSRQKETEKASDCEREKRFPAALPLGTCGACANKLRTHSTIH